MAPPVTQTFDTSIGEYGQDYAVPVGTPIYSPVSGYASTEDLGKLAWGKRVFVHAANGLSFAVGHMTQFVVSAGQYINAGDLLGYSGGAASDPSSGESTGPHVETQFFNWGSGSAAPTNPGHYVDPRNVFQQFADWEQRIFSGGAPATVANSMASNLNPLAGVADAITGATSSIQKAATRAAWFAFGLGVFVIGLFLIFGGDIEKAVDDVQDKAQEAGKAAAAIAAPEVAVPAEAAAAA